jgi:hypothetical protein
MERGIPGGLTGAVSTATRLGYAMGLFLLVRLGDLRRAQADHRGRVYRVGARASGHYDGSERWIRHPPFAAGWRFRRRPPVPPGQRGATVGRVTSGNYFGQARSFSSTSTPP